MTAQAYIAPQVVPGLQPPSRRRGWGGPPEELQLLLERWRALGRLRLAQPDEVALGRRSEVFAAYEDEDRDRQLLDRRAQNVVEEK
eukprot:9252544-Lingulodinium_polyedra.AAC.1